MRMFLLLKIGSLGNEVQALRRTIPAILISSTTSRARYAFFRLRGRRGPGEVVRNSGRRHGIEKRAGALRSVPSCRDVLFEIDPVDFHSLSAILDHSLPHLSGCVRANKRWLNSCRRRSLGVRVDGSYGFL